MIGTDTAMADERLADLRRWNLGLTVLHVVQAVAVLTLASDFAVTVTSSFPTGPPGAAPPGPDALFDIPIGAAVAAFLALAPSTTCSPGASPGGSTRTTCAAASTGSGGWSTPSAPPS